MDYRNSARMEVQRLRKDGYTFEWTDRGDNVYDVTAFRNGTPAPEAFSHHLESAIGAVLAEELETGPPDSVRLAGDAFDFGEVGSADFAAMDLSVDWLIHDFLASSGAMLLAGPKKTLKTGLMVDLAISLAIEHGAFLGAFRSPKPRRVVFVSAESGKLALRLRADSVCRSIGVQLAAVENLYWAFEAPKFSNAQHLAAIGEMLERRKPEVLIIDPAYFCLDGEGAGNLFQMVDQLKPVADLCERAGCVLILAHHTTKALQPGAVPELADMQWSGFPEFAAQWCLLNRRTPYEPGSGEHDLIMSVGSRALFGGGGLHAVDVHEGDYRDLQWHVEVSSGADAMAELRKEAAKEKTRAQNEREAAKVDTIRNQIVRHFGDSGEKFTKREVRDVAGRSKALPEALLQMVESGELTETTKTVGNNNRKVEAYQFVQEPPE